MSVPKSLLKMALKMYTVSYRQHSNIFFIICYLLLFIIIIKESSIGQYIQI